MLLLLVDLLEVISLRFDSVYSSRDCLNIYIYNGIHDNASPVYYLIGKSILER